MGSFRRFYGSHPLHLLALLGCFALVGAVLTYVVPDPSAWWLLVWFAGAVIAHDLVLYPLYALADRSLVLARWARRRVSDRPVTVAATNYVRLPVLASAVLGLVYLPTISGNGAGAFVFSAGRVPADHVTRWLLLTAGFFLVGAVLYAARLGREAVRS